MFKKFISDILLSIAIDKSARNKLGAFNKNKRSMREPNSRSELAPEPPVSIQIKNPIRMRKLTPLNDLKKSSAATKADSPDLFIKENLDGAQQELNQHFTGTSQNKLVSKERKALIDKAMAIRRSKLYILNELDREQLNKLTAMAIQALNVRIQK